MKEINWEKAFTIYFDMENGLADKKPIQRRLSDMKDMYYDSEAVEDLINENPLFMSIMI